MSHFLDRLTYFRRQREKFSDGHGITTDEPREWSSTSSTPTSTSWHSRAPS